MRNGRSKNIGARLEILRHEAAIRSTDATDFLTIDKTVFLHEFLRALNDIVC